MCFVGKAATITWLRVLLRLTENPHAVKTANINRHTMGKHIHKFLVRMDTIKKSSRKTYLMSTYKIMIVRDPLVRLISGYREKIFTDPSRYYSNLHHHIKKALRSNVSGRFSIISHWFCYIYNRQKLETKASSHAGQCIPAESSVSLPRRWLITIPINVKKLVSLKHGVRAINQT